MKPTIMALAGIALALYGSYSISVEVGLIATGALLLHMAQNWRDHERMESFWSRKGQ
jgi:hypothetical protein